MVYASWGKNSKKIGYWGIVKCNNCKNYAHFNLLEVTNNVKLYFVTVAKYNKKRYLVCPICETGFELNEDNYNYFIEQMPTRFSEEVTNEIWHIISTEFSGSLQSIVDSGSSDDFIAKTKSLLVNKYGNEENVSEIINTYLKCTLDKDKAR